MLWDKFLLLLFVFLVDSTRSLDVAASYLYNKQIMLKLCKFSQLSMIDEIGLYCLKKVDTM